MRRDRSARPKAPPRTGGRSAPRRSHSRSARPAAARGPALAIPTLTTIPRDRPGQPVPDHRPQGPIQLLVGLRMGHTAAGQPCRVDNKTPGVSTCLRLMAGPRQLSQPTFQELLDRGRSDQGFSLHHQSCGAGVRKILSLQKEVLPWPPPKTFSWSMRGKR